MSNKNIVRDESVYVNVYSDLPLFAALTEKSGNEVVLGDVEQELLDDSEAIDDGTLSPIDQQILDILRGRRSTEALLGPDICRAIGIPPTANGQRKLRTHVARLVMLGYPIGTRRTGQIRGFHWLLTPEDIRASAAHLRSQGFKILTRAARLEKSAYAAERRGQLRLAG